jgi:hypothetical protein
MTKKPPPNTNDERPKSSFTSNMGPEDVAWPGADSDELLNTHGYEPDQPLELLLRALIEAHADGDMRSDDERLEVALGAVLGLGRQPGMKDSDDYAALLTIARAYHTDFISTGTEPDIAPLIRRELPHWLATQARASTVQEDSIIRRLRTKFLKQKDLLLVRATTENDWNSRDKLRAVGKIADQIREFGIPIGRPRRRTEPKPPY